MANNQVKELINLLIENNLDELKVEDGELKVHLKRNGVSTQAAPLMQTIQSAPAPVAATAAVEAPVSTANAMKSPMVGTYYSKPSPDSAEFVKVGDKIKAGQEICIIEAMKTMNRIEADRDGTVKQILVTDGQAVEYDEPLFVIA
jgi:acetyl-CoA carboxylase biotin carboxyl carrier protein